MKIESDPNYVVGIMRLEELNVIVAGAGTGGCAAALLLARAGARVTIAEKVPQPRAVGAGIAMAENGLAVLESLGLGPALEVGRPVVGARISDAMGRTLLDAPSPAPRVVMLPPIDAPGCPTGRRRGNGQRRTTIRSGGRSRRDRRLGHHTRMTPASRSRGRIS